MISPGVFTVGGDGLVRAGIAAFVQGHDADLIIRAGPSGAARHLRQVVRAEEAVPERLGRAVAVEDARRQQPLEADAALAFERTAHCDDAVQTTEIGGMLFLPCRQLSSADGTPIRNVTPYRSTASKHAFAPNIRMTTSEAPA